MATAKIGKIFVAVEAEVGTVFGADEIFGFRQEKEKGLIMLEMFDHVNHRVSWNLKLYFNFFSFLSVF